MYKPKPCKVYAVTEKLIVKMPASYGPDLTLLEPRLL